MAQADDTRDLAYAAARGRIEDLLARYCFALDWLDPVKYAGVFAEDGVLDWAGGIARGRDAIGREMESMTAYFARMADASAPLRPARLRHLITNVALHVEGDRATGRAYWFELDNAVRGRWPYVGGYGHSDDEFVRIDGEWLIGSRKIYNEMLPDRVAGQDNPVTWG